MDAARIQQKVYSGYGKAAIRVGYLFNQYRLLGVADPINPGNLVGQLNAAFTVGPTGFRFERTPSHKDVLFNGLFDGSEVQAGDYFVSTHDGSTYFVGQMAPILPPLCVLCNRVVTFSKTAASQTFGLQPAYEGTTSANEQAAMTRFPIALLFDARGRGTEVGLPTDLPSPFFLGLAPAIDGIDLRSGMFVQDETNRRYIIAASELTDMGWRFSAQQAIT